MRNATSDRTADLSRRHAVQRSDSGVVTITGGKLTTFAIMARDALAAAQEELGDLAVRTRVLEPNAESIEWPRSLTEEDRLRLLGRFGAGSTRSPAIARAATTSTARSRCGASSATRRAPKAS